MEKFTHTATDYVIKNIVIMKYHAKIRHNKINQRKLSSFMYVTAGKYHYKSDKIDFYVEPGDTIYIPYGASYEYTVLSNETECIQTEFNLEQKSNAKNNIVTISKEPFVIKNSEHSTDLLFRKLLHCRNNEFSTLALLYNLLAISEKTCHNDKAVKNGRFKIEPAIRFIEQHFKEKIYVADIAKMCGLSESHIRRLFIRHLGVSPIEYKNSILIKTACDILRYGELNVTEAAESLNFGDIYTFSMFFKKETGISPKKYIETYRK